MVNIRTKAQPADLDDLDDQSDVKLRLEGVQPAPKDPSYPSAPTPEKSLLEASINMGQHNKLSRDE